MNGSGTRSSLMYETLRIVKKLKPKYVLWENVKNVISKKHIHNFNKYLQILELGGYNNYYQVLNAKDYGIPQNRERVFTLSIRKDIDNGYTFPSKEELKLRLKDMLEKNVDEKYYLSDKMINFFYKNEQKQKEKGNGFRFGVSNGNVIAKSITTRAGGRMDDNFIKDGVDRIGGIFDTENLKHQAGSIYDKNGLAPTIDTMQDGYRQPLVEITPKLNNNDKRLQNLVNNTKFEEGKPLNLDTYNQKASEISQTLTEPHHNTQRVFDGLRIRKLTPKECWRLMGFSDENFDRAKATRISDTQLYKQAGNSIVVNVLEKILEELFINKIIINQQQKLW